MFEILNVHYFSQMKEVRGHTFLLKNKDRSFHDLEKVELTSQICYMSSASFVFLPAITEEAYIPSV